MQSTLHNIAAVIYYYLPAILLRCNIYSRSKIK